MPPRAQRRLLCRMRIDGRAVALAAAGSLAIGAVAQDGRVLCSPAGWRCWGCGIRHRRAPGRRALAALPGGLLIAAAPLVDVDQWWARMAVIVLLAAAAVALPDLARRWDGTRRSACSSPRARRCLRLRSRDGSPGLPRPGLSRARPERGLGPPATWPGRCVGGVRSAVLGRAVRWHSARRRDRRWAGPPRSAPPRAGCPASAWCRPCARGQWAVSGVVAVTVLQGGYCLAVSRTAGLRTGAWVALAIVAVAAIGLLVTTRAVLGGLR